MRRFLAIVLAGMLGFAAPAFAQSTTSGQPNQPTQPNATTNQPQSDDALTALNQAPPPDNTNLTPWLIGGLAVGGMAGIIIYATNNHSNNPTGQSSTSP